MSNWFQDHPGPSIVTYTLVVIGATWATSTFVLQDNRLNLAKSEIESQKSLAEQFKSKTELLQKDIETLRAENQEYRNWLAQSKDAVPIMVPQLIELKKQLAQFSTKSSDRNEVKVLPPQPAASSTAQPPDQAPPLYKGKPKQVPQNFNQPRTAKLGSAAFDETTGAVLTVKQTFTDRTALLLLTLPDRAQVLEERAYAGKQFKFSWGGRTISLTVLEINFFTDTVVFRMQPTDA